MRELSKMNLGRFIISACSFFGGIEVSQVDSTSIGTNQGSPSGYSYAPNPLESRGVVASVTPILAIFSLGALAQITSAIIKRIVVNMVTHFPCLAIQNFSVHPNSPIAGGADSVKGLNFRRPHNKPVPLVQPLKVFGIHERILSLRQWYQSVRWVGWLRNKVPLNSALWHESSLKDLCNAAILA